MLLNGYYNKNKRDNGDQIINDYDDNQEDVFEDEFEIVQDEDESDTLNCNRNSNSNRESLLEPFSSHSLQLFLDQDINKIRKESEPFCDSQFKPSLDQIVKNSSSKLAEYLLLALGINIPELKEMKSRIKWKRCKVCCSIKLRLIFYLCLILL
jgi:hypothetical protein